MTTETVIVGAVVAALVALYTGSIASIIHGLRNENKEIRTILADTIKDSEEKAIALEARHLVQAEKLEREYEKRVVKLESVYEAKLERYREDLKDCHKEREIAVLWRARYEQRIQDLERATLEGRVSATPNEEGTLIIETVNVAVSRMFGYTREELIGMPVEKLVAHEYRERHLEKVQSHSQEIFKEFDRVINGGVGLRKDGTQVPVTVELKSVLINGKPGWAAIITLA